jgi:hypothetical protein
MNKLSTALGLSVLLALSGCGQGTSGGPGAAKPPEKANTIVQPGDTFSLSLTWTKLSQGETKEVEVDIKRGTNFSEDVFLRFTGLPKGVSLNPDSPLIKHGEQVAKFTITAAPDAALGDFTSMLIGHPTKGADSSLEVNITVTEMDTAKSTTDAAKAQWAEFTASMQQQMDQLSVEFEALKARAAKAEGQARADLELKLAASKAKMDAAAAKLEELKASSADRWEKIKDGVAAAIEDLKKALA